MHHVIAASCNTGSFQQKWNCGWNAPTTTAAHAGAAATAPVLIGLVILAALLVAWASRGRSRTPATSK
jgi:hypothetical protein